jgi:hypothetical protein
LIGRTCWVSSRPMWALMFPSSPRFVIGSERQRRDQETRRAAHRLDARAGGGSSP